jgi:2-oxoisovalerate dehydrogenase E1 component
MFDGQISFPLVLRTRFAVGAGYGGQHSMNPVGLFGLFPGWRIIAPSNPFDYVGLFNTAVRFNDPVLMIDEHRLYPEKGSIPVGTMDYYVEYGKAKVLREGTDVTVLSYLKGVRNCLAAAKGAAEDGIDAEVIDLRTLDYIGLDYDTIGLSVRKTHSVLIVEDAARSMGLTARVSDEIQERFLDYLDCPVAKLTLPDVPPPVSRGLERDFIPSLADIKAKIIQGGRHHF